jgi:two-component system, cell cycle response regulator
VSGAPRRTGRTAAQPLGRTSLAGADAFADAPLSLTPRRAAVLSSGALRGLALVTLLATAGALALGPVALAWVIALAGASAPLLLWAARVARPSSDALLLCATGLVACAVAASGEPTAALGGHAIAAALGALAPGRRLQWLLPAGAVVLVAAVARTAGGETDALALALAHGVFFLGFGALGRGLFFGTLFFVRRREQARADEEVLRIVEDARLYRVTGSGDDVTDDSEHKQLIARTLAAKDAAYRALTLGAQALAADGAALYLVDAAGDLVLREQHVDAERPLAAKLGPKAGVPGLALQKKIAVRLVDADGAVIRAHNGHAKSALAVPLIERGSVLGVLLFDRTDARAFSEHDERAAMLLAREVLSALGTERVLSALDEERRRVARVLGAARAFSGVVRLDDALDQILAVTRDLAPRAGVAVLTVERAEAGAPLLCVARVHGDARLEEGARAALDPESWLGRALTQRAALPHTRLHEAPTRGLLAHDDGGTRALGDLFVLPLIAQGEVGGLLVVTAAKGMQLSREIKVALGALADLAGLALSGAKLFFLVEQRATTDGLTGLYNRRTLDEKLKEAITRARRSGQALAVALTDVDHFKRVNDTYGHGTGDEVLKGVSAALKSTARTSDVVGRYGGEEFVLVLEATDGEGAVRLAERARMAIKALSFSSEKGPLSVTSSFGVALYAEGDDALKLLERADQNLYRAKEAGRDRVVL